MLTLQTFDAIDAMADNLKTTASIDWGENLKKLNPFVATEPRMVWQLGVMYYYLMYNFNNNIDDINIILIYLIPYIREKITNQEVLNMFKVYDHIQSEVGDLFIREMFDGSIQTLQALIDFLKTKGILRNGVDKSSCRSFPPVDLNKVEVRNRRGKDTSYTYDGKTLTKIKSLGKGSFGQVDLYSTSDDESVAIKTYLKEDDVEITLLRDVTDFVTCNVIGVRLLNDTTSVMVPANGSLDDFKLEAGGDAPTTARTLIVEVAEMYRCMIERRNLYYFDIKPANVLFTCNSETGKIKCLIGDVGGLAKLYESAVTTFLTPLPFKHIYLYRLEERQVVVWAISDFLNTLPHITNNINPKNIVEGTLFVAIVFEGKEIVLLAEDGPTMLRKFKALVGIRDNSAGTTKERKILCAIGDSGRCKKSDQDDGNCYYNTRSRRCAKKKKLIVKIPKKVAKTEKKEEILCAMSSKGRCKKSSKADGKCTFHVTTKRCRKIK